MDPHQGRLDAVLKKSWELSRAFATLRQEAFENHEPEDLARITDYQLGRFISESKYRWFPQDEEPEDPG